jgi:hypothetical protein
MRLIKSLILLLVLISCQRNPDPSYEHHIRFINSTTVSIDTIRIYGDMYRTNSVVFSSVDVDSVTEYKLIENLGTGILIDLYYSNTFSYLRWQNPSHFIDPVEFQYSPSGLYTFEILDDDSSNIRLALVNFDFL